VDVVVVGTGAAGCCAAIAARIYRPSCKILVLEKSATFIGGTTRIAGGGWVWFPNNPFLKKMGIHEKTDDIVQLMMSWSKESNVLGLDRCAVDEGDSSMIRAFAEEAPDVIKQLIDADLFVCSPVEVRLNEDRVRIRDLLELKLAESKSGPLSKLSEETLTELSSLMPSYCGEHDFDRVPCGKILQPTGMNGGTSRQLLNAVKSQKN